MSVISDREDTCKPGDPDPSRHGRGDCPAKGADGTEWPWLCTREKGHSGQHVACGIGHVVATWAAEDGSDLKSVTQQDEEASG